jgi:hypothetical protein
MTDTFLQLAALAASDGAHHRSRGLARTGHKLVTGDGPDVMAKRAGRTGAA